MTSSKGFVAQIVLGTSFPLPRTDLAYDLCDRYAKRGLAVQYRDADLDFRNLPVKVPFHEALAHQLHPMHLRFDTASAVGSAPSPR